MLKTTIPTTDSLLIERLQFEYNAGITNIKYLMKDEDVRRDILQEYIDITEARFVELEMQKEAMAKLYLPAELVGKQYCFAFDFENECIEYNGACHAK